MMDHRPSLAPALRIRLLPSQFFCRQLGFPEKPRSQICAWALVEDQQLSVSEFVLCVCVCVCVHEEEPPLPEGPGGNVLY